MQNLFIAVIFPIKYCSNIDIIETVGCGFDYSHCGLSAIFPL